MKKILVVIALFSVHLSAFAEQRIISAGAGVTELIYALGAQSDIVAVDSTSRYLVKGSEIPQVGYHRALSTEGLLALKPDLLIGSVDMGPEITLKQLKSAKVNVVVVPKGDEVTDLYARIDVLADLTNTQKKAAEIKQQVAASVKQLQANSPEKPVSVVFLLINAARPLSVGGANTAVDKVISLAGAVNPAQKEFTSYKPVSQEAIVAMQPDYILISEHAWKNQGGIEGVLKKFPLLSATPAGKNRQILAIPGAALSGGFGLESIKTAKSLSERLTQPL